MAASNNKQSTGVSGGSESNYKPDGTGWVMGDTAAMPDRGTSTGMGDNAQTGGMSLDQSATNSQGAVTGTQGTPMGECFADDPAVGSTGGHDRGTSSDAKRGFA